MSLKFLHVGLVCSLKMQKSHFLIMFQIIVFKEMRICQQNSAPAFICVVDKTMSIIALQVKGI